MSLRDRVAESKVVVDVETPGAVDSKSDFYDTYEIIKKHELTEGELSIFEEYSFFPIKRKADSQIMVITKNKDVKQQLVRLPDKTPLKLISRYAKNRSSIVLCDDTVYFDLVESVSVINKDYSNDEAKSFFEDLLTDASRKMASDIHIRWEIDAVTINYRMDGKLREQPKRISKELGNALKNIFVNKSGESEFEENEIAGQMSEIIDGKEKEYRVSIGPTVHGNYIVIRLESEIDNDTNLVKWGYSPRAIEMIRELYAAHHGIVLVTGPTGSGKSTLLYSIIMEMKNMSEDNPAILTVEDPVEIPINGISQVQVNTKGKQENWMTFSRAIKMFLRQDPDLIVVGEIRDPDVALQAITAAKTGHLTLSTLHTNDVKSTFTRLNELDIDNANIEDGVRGVISHKLINRLCSNCKLKTETEGVTFYEKNPVGCQNCMGSPEKGYKGRVPIVEIASLNNMPENFKHENFEDYYSKEENIIYLLEQGIIDKIEAQKYMHIEDGGELSQRKKILQIWNRATKNKDHNNYIFPLFQTIIDSRGFITGYEAFLRMRDEDGEIISPKFFLDLVKKMGMYTGLSMFTLDKIIAQAKKTDKRVFVNIDGDNILDPDFASSAFAKIERAGVLNKIVFEFSFNKDYSSFIKFCNDKKIMVCLDNFQGSLESVVFMERARIKADFIKTTIDLQEGVSKGERWMDQYMNLLSEQDAAIIVNYIETTGVHKDIQEKYGKLVSGYQGFGISRPTEEI